VWEEESFLPTYVYNAMKVKNRSEDMQVSWVIIIILFVLFASFLFFI